ncbi:hypothetical protein GOV11_03495 [Candidatus Woesearchaeota archaeon]|nr:hypothetical protein [Candidatus Woesearchaeota archaeon]
MNSTMWLILISGISLLSIGALLVVFWIHVQGVGWQWTTQEFGDKTASIIGFLKGWIVVLLFFNLLSGFVVIVQRMIR